MKKIFTDSLVITDRDNPCEWALEVFTDNEVVALVDHTPEGARTPFVTLDREGALLLMEELADFLVQGA